MRERRKETVKAEIRKELDRAFELAKYLHDHPELGYQEVKASECLCEEFQRYGFEVDRGICGMPTAFRASFDSGRKGPVIAFCAEYDALPEIGHGCGHNLICTMSLLAAASLRSVLADTGGRVVVFGTPAEETSGGKVTMAEKGVFGEADIVMMAHPAPTSEESGSSLAMSAVQFSYYGKAAHAAAAPEKGINALDAVIELFVGINALRQHVQKDVLFHGIITSGGVAPNIVPDYAEARFYIRAERKSTLRDAIEKAVQIAHGAEIMTGARLEISDFEFSYDNMITNRTLSRVVVANQEAMGDTVHPAQADPGSLDLGNVSHLVPSVHAWVGFNDPHLVVHTREFADRTVSPKGRDLLYRGACTLAMSACDVLSSPELLREIKREFKLHVK